MTSAALRLSDSLESCILTHQKTAITPYYHSWYTLYPNLHMAIFSNISYIKLSSTISSTITSTTTTTYEGDHNAQFPWHLAYSCSWCFHLLLDVVATQPRNGSPTDDASEDHGIARRATSRTASPTPIQEPWILY